MDLQLILLINFAAISALAFLVVLVRRTPGAGSMLIAHAIVLLSALAAWFAFPAQMGTITSAVFLSLIALPALAINRAFRAGLLNDWARAAGYARLASIVHPAPGYRFAARLMAALAQGSMTKCIEALNALSGSATPGQKLILDAHAKRILDDWEGVLATARARPPVAPELQPLELRALGETGRLDEMVNAYEACRLQMAGPAALIAQMNMFALAGRTASVDRLIQEHLPAMAPDLRSYWQAVALARAGDPHALPGVLAETQNQSLTRAVNRHLAAVPPEPLSALSNTRLLSYEKRLANAPSRARFRLSRSPVTYALLLLIAIGFGVELGFDGSEDEATLWRIGALWMPSVIDEREWWRLATAMFLHFGYLHLAFNGLALWLLGTAAEARFGSIRTLTVYALGGLISMAVLVGVMWLGLVPNGLCVGASGAIMALIGAEGGRRLVLWLRERDPVDRQMLILLAIIVAFQSSLDLVIPAVSFTGHLSGVIAGALIGLAIAAFDGQRATSSPGPQAAATHSP